MEFQSIHAVRRIPRPRVTQRIASAAQYPVMAIVAAAGFGKSVALTDYLDSEHADFVRFDVRADQSTLYEFVLGFAQALDHRVKALDSFAEAQRRAMASDDAACDLAGSLAAGTAYYRTSDHAFF